MARLQRTYRAILRRHLAPLRPILWHRACVDAFPRLRCLPLELLELLLEEICAGMTESDALERAAGWLRENLLGELSAMIRRADLSPRKRARVQAAAGAG